MRNPLAQVLTKMKTTGYAFNKAKMDKKVIRCSTEASTIKHNENISILENKAGIKTTRNASKENLKINHNKFK
jgi:hypothetical protein